MNSRTNKAPVAATKCVLIADTRERHVLRHEKELEGITCQVAQITTGDYVVCNEGTILVVIERKSLDDFAASLKDGRHQNKRKLVELRDATGCRIMYIIEGPEFPEPTSCWGNIPYKHIESSMFHLMIREGVTILRTRDTLGTAKALARFVVSMDNLCAQDDDIGHAGTAAPGPLVTGPAATCPDLTVSLALLTAKHDKTDHEVAREMWSVLPGISVESADEYMKRWSLADVVNGLTRATVSTMKLATGKSIGKKALDSIISCPRATQIRMLGSVPGVSAATAVKMLTDTTLKDLLSWGVGGLEMVFMTAKRRVGAKLAARIISLFAYKYVRMAVVDPTPEPEPTFTVEELMMLLA